jgi:hypothetical protein
MYRKLQEEYSKWRLTVKIAKTKYISLGKIKVKQSRYWPGVAQKVPGS